MPLLDSDSQQTLLPQHINEPPKKIMTFIWQHLKRALPIAASYDASMGLIALQAFISRIGAAAEAPVIITGINFCMMLQFSMMLQEYFDASVLYGKLHAVEKLSLESCQLRKELVKLPRNAFAVGLLIWPVTFGMAYSEPLLRFLGQESPIPENAQTFMRSYAPFFLAIAPRYAMEFLILAAKKQKIAMCLTLPALGISITAQYFLGFYMTLGLEGLAWSFGGASLIPPLFFSIYVYKGSGITFFDSSLLLSWSQEDRQEIWRLIKKSLPTILSYTSDFAALFAVSLIAGSMSGNSNSIWNIATFFLGIDALFRAAAIQAGVGDFAHLLGQITVSKEYHLLRKAFFGISMGTVLMQLPVACFVIAAPQTFQSLLGENENDADVRHMLYLTIIYAIIDGIRFNILQCSRALGDNFMPSVISSVSLWLGVLLSYLLSNYTEVEVLGLPLGLTAGAALATLISGAVDRGTLIGRGWGGFWQKISPAILAEADQVQNQVSLDSNDSAISYGSTSM